MEAVLIMILFAITALSLYCIASKKDKVAGGLNVVSLCLIVAIAYQFHLVNTILWGVVGIVVLLLVVFILIRKYRKNKEIKSIDYGGK